jgi:hypothetical protein
VLRPYGLTQVLATHYSLAAAVQQKVQALASRREPQARDVFDLSLLFARADAEGVQLAGGAGLVTEAAVENAMGISFDEYTGKVIAFLDSRQAPIYQGRAAWDAMQGAVVARLEALG